ncbi:acyl-CoA dehydrogenase [Gordonibacter sp. 28C]|uniref:acyl-CoA dehydrogenase family protein n=1 Tax=Gordonibacter sp. 28C TaxID=2078569 RepID=UPI000DF7286D|nr:acyl-CoA dehydrogenase family protein [Gordonibacter sp. 28C]RDB64434.1 acyl-CoA dehydrogenase [Gordonibacter sp. 28C]
MYDFTKEEQMILSMVDDVCHDRIGPVAAEVDESDSFPWKLQELLAESGIISMLFEEKYGGAGVSLNCWLRCIERISQESCSVASIVTTATMGSRPLLLAGSEAQKDRLIPDIASGDVRTCFALTEPQAGTHVANIATTATKTNDGYVINGSKVFATGGSVADIFTIFAQVEESGTKKLTCFLVDRDADGLSIGRDEDKMGMRGSASCPLYFDNMEVPESAVVGKVGDGFDIVYGTLYGGRLCAAAFGIGLSKRAYAEALAYANSRVQFSQTIGNFQAIRLKLADMEIGIKAAELLIDHAATLYMKNDPELRAYSSCTKIFCAELANKVTADAIQIFGGYGYCKDYPVERLYRDARILTIFEGTSEILRTTLAKAALNENRKA